MNNEPKEIYLNCYDSAEINPEYNCVTNDFEELDGENVLWSADAPVLDGHIKYVHHSIFAQLEAENEKLREALNNIVILYHDHDRGTLSLLEQATGIAEQALKQK